jgi:signal transduction histidine kinase
LSNNNSAGLSGRLAERASPRPLTGISRRFGDLRIRPKLMVLHNLFFLALTCGIYFTLIPLIEQRLDHAQRREISLIWTQFSSFNLDTEPAELRAYELTAGAAGELGLPSDASSWLDANPNRIWQRTSGSEYLYKRLPDDGRYYRLKLPLRFYSGLIESTRLVLFIVLGVAYLAAVLILELAILPRYVYQPIRLLLDADAATRRGARTSEIVPSPFIPGDEIGQIVTSRNETVAELRRHEDDLQSALQQLELSARDLTQKNEMLETAKRNLEAQDRLVSLGLLSASVAHEMNTPLSVLHGSIEKLIETLPGDGAQARLQRMARVTNRLRRISESLVDFARVRKVEFAPVSVQALIDEAWQLVAIDEKASSVRFENLVPPSASVNGNADRLIQVFVNLLRNALNAVCDDGQICVYSRPRSIDGKPALAFFVEDNGPGIPAEVLPEIFEAFVTTRLDARGTGLGLTVAEGIVHQHGGAISAANRPNGGARLEIVLPAPTQE